jgi:hypothetical protein
LHSFSCQVFIELPLENEKFAFMPIFHKKTKQNVIKYKRY